MRTMTFFAAAFRSIHLPSVTMITCLLFPVVAAGQGAFTVEAADLPAMSLRQYYSADRKPHDAEFTWTFTKDTFTLRKGSAPIPADLVETLLAAKPKTQPDEITGSWSLKNGRLLLTGIKAGEHATKKEAALMIFKTAARVVRIGYLPQYMFEVKE